MKRTNTLLSSALLSAMVWIAGCSDGDICTRGSVGCACTEADTCDGDATCNDGMCEAGGAGGTSGTGGTGGTGGVGGIPTPDEVCTPSFSGLCVNRVESGSLTLFPEDPATACTYFCELLCERKAQWCPTHRCPADFCDPTAPSNGITACLDATADDLGLAIDACIEQDRLECPDVDCGDSEVPNCPEETTCLMTCGSEPPRGMGGQWANDGVCDDGGDSAEFKECDWGHDCEACGVRYGEAPACTPLSDCCRFTNECCGGFEGQAHCLGQQDDSHCRRDCTQSQTCPEDFECRAIVNSAGEETGSFACIPL